MLVVPKLTVPATVSRKMPVEFRLLIVVVPNESVEPARAVTTLTALPLAPVTDVLPVLKLLLALRLDRFTPFVKLLAPLAESDPKLKLPPELLRLTAVAAVVETFTSPTVRLLALLPVSPCTPEPGV